MCNTQSQSLCSTKHGTDNLETWSLSYHLIMSSHNVFTRYHVVHLDGMVGLLGTDVSMVTVSKKKTK